MLIFQSENSIILYCQMFPICIWVSDSECSKYFLFRYVKSIYITIRLSLQDERGQGRLHELSSEAEEGSVRNEAEGLQQDDRGTESRQIGRKEEAT